ncbi:MAG: hypothetical protein AAGJ40_09735 [Planctomycetota bacterium]
MASQPKRSATKPPGDLVHYTIEDRERLGRLESDVANLQVDFGELRAEVRSGFDKIASNMADHSRRVAEGGKTNWNVVLTGLGTIITLSIAAASVTVMYVSNAIRPQELASEYQLKQIQQTQASLVDLESKMTGIVNEEIDEFNAITTERSKTTDRRLTSSEDRISRNETAMMERSKLVGEMRERLATLEAVVEMEWSSDRQE